MTKSFDFENMDIKLLLALKAILPYAQNEIAGLYAASRQDEEYESLAEKGNSIIDQALLAIEEFELSCGPLPIWAIARNWGYSLVPGANLPTRDGRNCGNAHILSIEASSLPNGQKVFNLLSDAGNHMRFTESEIHSQFYIGDWISDVNSVIERFSRNDQIPD